MRVMRVSIAIVIALFWRAESFQLTVRAIARDGGNKSRLGVPCHPSHSLCYPASVVRRHRQSQLKSLNDDVGQEQRRPPNRLQQLVRKVATALLRLWTKYKSLSKRARRLILVPLILFAFMAPPMAGYFLSDPSKRPIEVAYSGFMDLAEQQRKTDTPRLENVMIDRNRITYKVIRKSSPPQSAPSITAKNKEKLDTSSYLSAYTRQVSASPELIKLLRDHDISFSAAPLPKPSPLILAVRSFLLSFYMLILWRLYQNLNGGSRDSPGKLAKTSELPMASFDDIQGIDSVKMEVMELVDALRNPDKYAILGARAPTGVLLEGPPGTGKTMLARATAASAGVPLLYCSGSDFVEMYVGRGAARIRTLFKRAEKLAPCIIFIDELDALGKSRSFEGFDRNNDEAEQTLNQLLTCMDGLDSSRRICVLAATNRRNVLDSALIRPGRFDRIVKLKLPDARGRENILRVHCRKLPGFQEGSGVDPNRPGALGQGRLVDLSAIAALTEGFSGAELEYLVNEAAIRAVRRVSAALRDGHSQDITPHVEARDFEESLVNFFETRRGPSMRGMNILKNVWKANS